MSDICDECQRNIDLSLIERAERAEAEVKRLREFIARFAATTFHDVKLVNDLRAEAREIMGNE